MEQSLFENPFPLLCSAATIKEALIPKGIQPKEVEACDIAVWEAFCAPLTDLLPYITPLESCGNRPLEFTFVNQIYTLVYFHTEEYSSGRALLEDVNDNKQSPPVGLPQDGLGRGTFFEALHSRGLSQMFEVFERLSRKAAKALGTKYDNFGSLCALDGSLVDATLSMEWADYTQTTNKAKVHLTFDINHSIPRQVILTEGKAPERPVADEQLQQGQTSVMDRGYQDHSRFDFWTDEGKYFVCRIKCNTQKTVVKELPVPPKSNIIFFAEVYLGDLNHRTQHTVRLVGYKVGRTLYWVATNRNDLSATEIAFIYRLRWEIETFFAWWKEHLNVYHLIARSAYGLMMQLLSGLITYLLIVLYFNWRASESPSLSLLRELRRDIRRQRAITAFKMKQIANRIITFFLTTRWRGKWLKQTIIVAIF
jgi:hypothetical protein